MPHLNTPIITIIGKSGAGKTTFLVKLIAELKRQGYKVGTVKHHSHRGFDIDVAGKDSWMHAQAGSDHVVIASSDKLASYRKLENELTLDEIAKEMQDIDIILVEGYKRAGKPSIEVFHSDVNKESIANPGQNIAAVTDTSLDLDIPQFSIEDSKKIVKLIETHFFDNNLRRRLE